VRIYSIVKHLKTGTCSWIPGVGNKLLKQRKFRKELISYCLLSRA